MSFNTDLMAPTTDIITIPSIRPAWARWGGGGGGGGGGEGDSQHSVIVNMVLSWSTTTKGGNWLL